MDAEVITVVSGVVHFDGIEGDVADDHIKELVRVAGMLEACDLDICAGIKVLCDMPGNGFNLHAVQPGICHAFRQDGEKVPGSHGRV